MAFFIGPDGGWCSEEMKLFDLHCDAHPDSVRGVSMGTTVSREEIAGTMAVGAYNIWCANFFKNQASYLVVSKDRAMCTYYDCLINIVSRNLLQIKHLIQMWYKY